MKLKAMLYCENILCFICIHISLLLYLLFKRDMIVFFIAVTVDICLQPTHA